MSSPIYWLNGKFLSAGEANIPLNDVGILRGFGVFDYLRTYDGKPFRLMAHLERLRSSASQIGLNIPLDLEEIADTTEKLVEKNIQVSENANTDFGIRFVVTGGDSPNNFMPGGDSSLAIMIHPIPDFSTDIYEDGVKLITTRLQREFPTVKSTNYIGAIMAMRQATAAGAAEALYVDSEDQISECTRSNFFVVQDGVLKTPEKNVLPGITRKVILEYAAEIVPFKITPVSLHDLQNVEEAFISSSTKEMIPVVQIDDLTIGDGKVGPITKALHARFRKETV